MSTRTRAQHQSSPSTRRFAKPGAKPQGRRPAAAGRPRAIGVARRRKPPKSSTAKALEALTGLVGGKKASGTGAKGAKAGAGVAMLTAAAGLAFKNREKLTSMLKRDGGAPATDASAPPAGTTGAAVHPITSANATDWSADAGDRAATPTPSDTSAAATSLDPAMPTSPPDRTGTPSTQDPPDTALGGVPGPGSADRLTDPAGSESPWVSPEPDPRAEEPPRDRS
jgi:hypothetical protein